jgi:hypothetical protein
VLRYSELPGSDVPPTLIARLAVLGCSVTVWPDAVTVLPSDIVSAVRTIGPDVLLNVPVSVIPLLLLTVSVMPPAPVAA